MGQARTLVSLKVLELRWTYFRWADLAQGSERVKGELPNTNHTLISSPLSTRLGFSKERELHATPKRKGPHQRSNSPQKDGVGTDWIASPKCSPSIHHHVAHFERQHCEHYSELPTPGCKKLLCGFARAFPRQMFEA